MDLTILGCQVVELVVSSGPGVPQGCMQGVVLAARARRSFTSSIPDLVIVWQCKPMGGGVVGTSRSPK